MVTKNEALKMFKHFAAVNGFWKKYKEDFDRTHHRRAAKNQFIDNYNKHIDTREPIMLIRQTIFFCTWSHSIYGYIFWQTMDVKWERYCLENGIWFNKTKAKNYFEDCYG